MPPSPRDEIRPLTAQERTRATIAYWICVGACVVFAAAAAYIVWLREAPIREARPVAARIEHVEMISRDDGHGHVRTLPLVIYSYTIGGVRYTTSRLTSLATPHGDRWAADVTRRYHQGDSVTAYYNPAEPGSAFLTRERSWGAYAMVGIPLLLALALVLYWPRALPGPRSP